MMASSDRDEINRRATEIRIAKASERKQQEANQAAKRAADAEETQARESYHDSIDRRCKEFAVWACKNCIPHNTVIGFRGGWIISEYSFHPDMDSKSSYGGSGHYAINSKGVLYGRLRGGSAFKVSRYSYDAIGLHLINEGIAQVVADSGKPW